MCTRAAPKERYEFPSGVLDGDPAEIKFGAFEQLNMASSKDNFVISVINC